MMGLARDMVRGEGRLLPTYRLVRSNKADWWKGRGRGSGRGVTGGVHERRTLLEVLLGACKPTYVARGVQTHRSLLGACEQTDRC